MQFALEEVQSQKISKDQEKFGMGAFIMLQITLRFCPSALMIMIAIGTQLMCCLGSNSNDKGGSMPKIWTVRTRWYFGCFLCLKTKQKKSPSSWQGQEVRRKCSSRSKRRCTPTKRAHASCVLPACPEHTEIASLLWLECLRTHKSIHTSYLSFLLHLAS